MTWKEIETMFNRALRFTFSKRKLLFTAPILIACGLISVFFRTLGSHVNSWLSISTGFTSLFFCLTILLVSGIFLTRIYHNEVKGLPVCYRKTLGISKTLMGEAAYLILPLILTHLVLWTLLGVFYLFKQIPVIGDGLGILLSFGPFLLLLASFILSLLSLSVLFFVTPSASLKSSIQIEVLQGVWKRFVWNPFTNIFLLFLSLLPFILMAGLMTLVAIITGKSYGAAEHPVAVSLEWFSMMIPFAILLTPTVIFFFNFSAESHVWMVKKMKELESGCGSPL